MLGSLFNSIWPVPIGFLFSLLVIMACIFRRRIFRCLKVKQSSVGSGTYTQHGEINTAVEIPINTDSGIIANSTPASQRTEQRSEQVNEYPILTLPNPSSTVSIISSPTNDTLLRGFHLSATSEQDSALEEAPPPSYGSLFYCPPPKYEDVVVTTQ
ncbi:unnamed protein product [Porites evermanni]|uniref:Uncharacterized protein n=1 Tax=Porites evermanni TaxID=104178 RepID=A0ABN8LXL1_9CNID|nr:unnamed protein product [Porites evermanni]